jgi:hypothetical protein
VKKGADNSKIKLALPEFSEAADHFGAFQAMFQYASGHSVLMSATGRQIDER